MAPLVEYPYSEDDHDSWKDFDIREIWRSMWAWILRTANAINHETIAHSYSIAFALLVVCAWPHILALPVWFGRDAYRRMENQTRAAASVVAGGPPRRRRRDVFIARYRAIMSRGYSPPPQGPSLFGGTPLTDGDFRLEEERELSLTFRIIRWCALAWATYILGREVYWRLAKY
ncbi:hypothetical protein BD410DRAFT_729606 [Rickenella mellea]|uniref:Uncharacterized protein n=1 Tax=Rickenella mellea TaxID=50990 RepID=A0A4Y7PQL7_9AGAM|nr:hypothetical protein BD410DRAFT_729606 [Rickenella mellea]